MAGKREQRTHKRPANVVLFCFSFETPGLVTPTLFWRKNTWLSPEVLRVEWTSFPLRCNKSHCFCTFPEELGQTLFLIAVKIPSDRGRSSWNSLILTDLIKPTWQPIQQALTHFPRAQWLSDLCRYPTPKFVPGPSFLTFTFTTPFRLIETTSSPAEQWFKHSLGWPPLGPKRTHINENI